MNEDFIELNAADENTSINQETNSIEQPINTIVDDNPTANTTPEQVSEEDKTLRTGKKFTLSEDPVVIENKESEEDKMISQDAPAISEDTVQIEETNNQVQSGNITF